MIEISSRRRWAITAGVMTGMLLAALEATVVGTAMPTIVAALGGLAHYSWVFSAYLLTSTVTVPLWGKLSDLFGRRIIYQIGIAAFLVGSALCGMSQTMTQLILARAFQGIGAGALVPLAMTIIGDIFTLQERAKMQGFFSGVWGVSSVIGPLIGGFITDQLSWRWVFYINLPVGIIAAIVIGVALIEPKREGRPTIDYLGAFVLTASVTIIMLAFSAEDPTRGIAPRNVALAAVGIGLLVAFVFVEKRAKDPVVPLGLFRNRVVSVSIGVGFLAGIAMFGAITFVPLLAQGVFGATATQAGTFLTPLMLSWVVASIFGGRLLLRLGTRPLVVAGLVFMIAGLASLSTFTKATARPVIMAELAVIGIGLGLTMLTLLIAAQHSVPREQLGITTSLNQFSRSIGGALGVALLGAVLAAGLGATDPNALISAEARSHIAPADVVELQDSLAKSLRTIFLSCAGVCVVALGWSFTLPPGKPGTHTPDAGEQMVMAEMTTIDAENEPCCD
jgi:EmrB/QacA subfamily drug resistance transporter